MWRFMTCLDWKSAALRRLSARFHRERELRFNGKGGVKKALWNIDRYDLTRAPFLFLPGEVAERTQRTKRTQGTKLTAPFL